MRTNQQKPNEKELVEYVNNLSDDSLARWYALLVGESFVAKKCGDNLDCIASHSNALCHYVNDVWEDIKWFLEKIRNGEEIEKEAMDSTYNQLVDVLGMQD